MGMVIVNFGVGNYRAAKHFVNWLNGSGEQDYWNWMDGREFEEDGPITATRFVYPRCSTNAGNFIVDVELGRMENE